MSNVLNNNLCVYVANIEFTFINYGETDTLTLRLLHANSFQ